MIESARNAPGLLGLLVPGAALLWAAAALPAAAEGGKAAAALEEILVTARKRQVTLQEAPVAVSVVGGEDFDKSNIVKLDNFNGFVPGLVVAKNDGAGRVATIRGVGWETAQNLASQPSVLTYIDGVYLANPLAMGLDLGELDRIEVFRGPQGTEFGQGTTGGAINLVTKKPRLGEQLGKIELGYGTYDTFRGQAAVNLPLGDAMAIRASVQRYQRDGFAEIAGGALDGYHLDDAESTTGKIALMWAPADSFSALAQVFLHNSDQNAAAQKSVADPISNARRLSQDFPGIFELDNTSASLILEWETALGVTIKSLTGWQKLEKEQSVDGDRLTEELFRVDINGFFSDTTWDLLPFWDNDSDAFSQEISISYEGDQLDWVGGGYYLDHENYNDFLEAVTFAGRPFTEQIHQKLLNASPATLPPFGASELLFNETRTVSRQDYAIYGQATLQLSDRVAVTAGLRYQGEDQTDETVQFYFLEQSLATKDSGLTWKAGVDIALTDDNLIYGLLSTGWKNGGTNPGALTNNAIFLAGEFEPEEVTSLEVGTRNTLLEDRMRLNVTAFYYDHDHLQFIYEDPRPFSSGTGTIANAEEYGVEAEFSLLLSENWQLDGMAAWQEGELKSDINALDVAAFRELLGHTGAPTFIGSLSDPINSRPVNAFFAPVGPFYNDSCGADGQVYYETGSPGNSQRSEDKRLSHRCRLALNNNLKGNEPPKLPDFTVRLALTNTRNFSNGSLLASRLEYIHRGEFQARVFNNPAADKVPSYNLVNLHFAYEFANAPLSLALSVTNLFDEDGVNNVFTNPFGSWTTSEEFIPPREVIASVKYWFSRGQ